MLTNIAQMQHEMLKQVADGLADEEDAAGRQSEEERRKKHKKTARS